MRLLIAAAGIFSLAAAPALADATFDSLDTDDNGKISKDEFYGLVSDAGMYSDWDVDGDGLVERNEFGSIEVEDDFGAWDADNDEYLDADEVYDHAFTRFDVDESGHWDGEEWDDAGEAGWLDF